jgi:hypothetical protein
MITNCQLRRTGHECALNWGQPSQTTDIYRLLSDDPDENPLIVGTYAGLPILGTTYLRNFGGDDVSSQTLILVSKTPRQVENETTLLWDVYCRYSDQWLYDRHGKGKNKVDGTATDVPTQWRDELETGFVQFRRPADDLIFMGTGTDPGGIHGTTPSNSLIGHALTSASQPFDPDIEDDDTRRFYRITQYLNTPPDVDQYCDAVNVDTFTVQKTYLNFNKTFQPFTCKMTAIHISNELHNNIAYWKVMWEFQVKPETWDMVLLDQGNPVFKVGVPNGRGGIATQTDVNKSSSPWYVPLDASGTPIKPLFLDGQGNLLAKGAQPFYRTYRRKKLLPFANLSL